MKRHNIVFKIGFVFLLFLVVFPRCYGDARSDCEELFDLHIKEYKSRNFTISLEYLKKIETLSIENKLLDIQVRMLNSFGLVYMHVWDYDKAMACFLKGHEIAVEIEDKSLELSILSNIAQWYFLNKELDKAADFLEKSYEIARNINDTIRMSRVAINIAIIANEIGDLGKAEQYLDLSIQRLENIPNYTSSLIKAKIEKIRNFYLKEDYDSALELAFQLTEQEQKIEYEEDKSILYFWLSKLYSKKGDTERAIFFAQEALTINHGLVVRIDILQHLSQLYKNNNLPLFALLYQDSLLLTKDSLERLNDMNRIENMQVRLDLINSEKALNEHKAKQKTERIIYAFVIIIAVILIWMLRLQLRRNKLRKYLELQIEKKEKLMLEQQLREQEALSLLEKEKLNNEINEKNRQLTAKVLVQSGKNETIGGVIEKLSIISAQGKNIELDLIINQLKMQLKESSEWDGFLTYFEQANPSFLLLLNERYPDLSSGDIRLLSYIYINLDTKEIAKLLNITHDHCRKKKQRLAKKIGIPTTELHSYLINLA